MNRTIKFFVSGIILIFTSLLYSCEDKIEVPQRTPEIEKTEINEALASLVKEGFTVDSTSSGLYYIMHKEGSGPYPEKSDTCGLIYNGFFLSGHQFDSSGLYYEDSVWHFRYLEVPLIKGFDEGVALLNKGAIADILIPSSLGYGAMGYGSIPPYTPLFFNLKLVELNPLIEEEDN